MLNKNKKIFISYKTECKNDKEIKNLSNNDKSDFIELNEDFKYCTIILNLKYNIVPSYDNDTDYINDKCICNVKKFHAEINLNSKLDEQELIPEIKLQIYDNYKVKLSDVINNLINLGYPLKSSAIYYYSLDADEYIYCGCEPIIKTNFVDINKNNSLTLECHCMIEQDILKDIELNIENFKQSLDNINNQLTCNNNLKENNLNRKRTKERKIGYIIDKVSSWRKLYNGYYNESKTFVKYSLDEAAKILNISKKSLDDYLLQLRLGRKFGFNFNKNKNSRVGVLRAFVKNQRTKLSKRINEDQEDSTLMQ